MVGTSTRGEATSRSWLARKLPAPVKARLRRLVYTVRFAREFGFFPPPPGTDLIGYETILRFMRTHRVLELQGDVVEIGCFLGGGTYKLSRFMERYAGWKKLYVIDIFDPAVDGTMNTSGVAMRDMYSTLLSKIGGGRKSQYEVFSDVTKGCKNLVVIKGDSKLVELPTEQLCFGIIDGNHEPSYVRNDFEVVWSRLVPRGWVVFDDYGHDLPLVTRTIDKLIAEHGQGIAESVVVGKLIFLRKK